MLTLVTTLPAPTTDPFPIVIPLLITWIRIGSNKVIYQDTHNTIVFPPIQQSSSIITGFATSGPWAPLRFLGSIGCVAEKILTFGDIIVRSFIVTW